MGEPEWQLRAADLFLSSWRRNVKVSKRKSRRKNTKKKNEKGSTPGRRFFCTSGQKKEENWSVSWASVPLVSLCLFFCCWSNLKHTNKLKQAFFNRLDIYANFNCIIKENINKNKLACVYKASFIISVYLHDNKNCNSRLFSVLRVYQSKITPQMFYSGNTSGMIRGASRGKNTEIKVLTGYSDIRIILNQQSVKKS